MKKSRLLAVCLIVVFNIQHGVAKEAGPLEQIVNRDSEGICRPATGVAFSEQSPYLLASASAVLSSMQGVAADGGSNPGTELEEAQRAVASGNAAGVIPVLRRIIERAEETGDQRLLAQAQGVLGLALSAQGETLGAQRAFNDSIAGATELNAPGIEARSRFNAANLALNQSDIALDASGARGARNRGAASITTPVIAGEGFPAGATTADKTDEIIAAYKAAASAAARAGDRLLEARALLNAGRLETLLSENDTALASLKSASSAAQKTAPTSDRALIEVGIGDAFLFLAEQSRKVRKEAAQASAAALFDAIDVSTSESDIRTQSFARGVLGKLYLANRDYENALAATRQALALAQSENAKDISFQWRGQIGDIYRATGESDRAFELYRAAINEVKDIRGSLAAVDPISGRSLFRSTVEPIFLSYADLLISKADGDEAGDFLLQARDVVDSLKEVELEQFFQDDCVSGLLADRLEEAPDRVAILYPIMFPDRLELIIESGGRLSRATSDVTPQEIAQASAALRAALQFAPAGDNYAAPARQLYQWLIAPVETTLREADVQTVIFAPDASLRGVPLGVLQDQDGTFLVQKFATATAISASLIAKPGERRFGERRALYASLSLKQQGFPALAAVAAEIEAAREIFPGPEPLADESFTESRLAAELNRETFDIIHFATHATFGGKSENSFLLAYSANEASGDPGSDGRITIDEFETMISSSRIRGGDIELITLSACETAAGNDQSILGLAGVAYKSGARSVFASLWAINDLSTAKFVPSFYEAMKKKPKAQALQSAQVQFIEQGGDLAHPYYWSPFILLGEWE